MIEQEVQPGVGTTWMKELTWGQELDLELREVISGSGPADDRKRVLKQGDTFAVLDSRGDINPNGIGEGGIYYHGTRYLSLWLLVLEGKRPLYLSSTVREDTDQLQVDLTNPPLQLDSDHPIPHDTLYISQTKFLWQDVCYQELRIQNYGQKPVKLSFTLHFQSDFADIFEVRGSKRPRRGEFIEPQVSGSSVDLQYRGLDRELRHCRLSFSPAPVTLSCHTAHFQAEIPQQQTVIYQTKVACQPGNGTTEAATFATTREKAESHVRASRKWNCNLRTSSNQFNEWITRAEADLHLLTTHMETGPYPYAGVPWFSTPFGRDGLITAMECLWMRPSLAKGVLSYLAETQATESSAEQDAEPGKILHEAREGEMAALKEIPFGRYYGSIDSTPLFVLLAGLYYERTGDRGLIDQLWPNIDAALQWIDRSGDSDGDGLVEYHRQSAEGLVQQGWKDSSDSVMHADGSLAEGPIALCEVQGYVYAARQAGATLARLRGLDDRASQLEKQAADLKQCFETAFWCEDIGTYALALDGQKRPCKVHSSNVGHCLLTGIANPDHIAKIVHSLMGEHLYSGWGVRTLGANEARFNPMAYHNGSIWPHDNAMIAYGLARYGYQEKAMQILEGLFDAALSFDLHRLPELFCGFPRSSGAGPTLYPVACAPQAWAAASVFLIIQGCLGLTVNGPERQIHFARPRLPAVIREMRITNLEIDGASMDLLLIRHEKDVGINVLRRTGDIELIIRK